MSTITEQLGELKAQFADFASDVKARLEQLEEAQGTFSPDAQAIFDDLKRSVADADAGVGDADGSETPAPPVEPPAGPDDGTVSEQ